MGAVPEVVVHRDADLLAASAAARLITAMVDAQTARGAASVVLTGGGIGVATLRAVRASPALDAVDWGRVDVWWGDERFVPAGSPDRNDGQARAALLDALPLDPTRVFPMGGADAPPGGTGPDAGCAAAAYARLLADHASPGTRMPVPSFDVLLLGIGPDGHVASLFPGSPVIHAPAVASVAAVYDSPKPPPVRITLTFPAIQAAREVWVLAAGEGKADAVVRALGGASPAEIPAVAARGQERTLWLLDAAAAAAWQRP